MLREAGLVSERCGGRQRLYRFHPEQFADIAEWVRQHYERFWRERMGALGRLLGKTAAASQARPKEDES